MKPQKDLISSVLGPARRQLSWLLARRRLRRLLGDFFVELGVRQPIPLAQAFASSLGRSDESRIRGIISNFVRYGRNRGISQKLAVGNPGSVISGVSRPLEVLIIAAMLPSWKHAGGLRLSDIITRLHGLGYGIWLYSPSGDGDDEPIRRNLAGCCRSARFVEIGRFDQADLYEWLQALGRSIDSFDLIQYEWPFYLDRFSQTLSSGPIRVFTHMESVFRRYAIELDLKGSALAGTGLIEFLDRLSWDAFLLSLAYAHIPNQIVLTEGDLRFESRFFPGRLAIIPTGLSDEFMASGPIAEPADGLEICLVGSFGHSPNRDAVLWFMDRVYPQIKARIDAAAVVIVGSGPTDDLRARYGGRATFTGEVESVVPYIQRSAVCVAPLISGAGIRGKVNQYAILGKPIVATSIALSGLPYRDRESVWIADEPDDFAAGVVTLLRDKPLAKSMGSRARETAAANYSWTPIIEKLDRFYREIVA